MLYWQSNFQISNSGVQSAEVFAQSELIDDIIIVNFYAEEQKINLLFTKEYEYKNNEDVYEYLLSLEDFSNYTRV